MRHLINLILKIDKSCRLTALFFYGIINIQMEKEDKKDGLDGSI